MPPNLICFSTTVPLLSEFSNLLAQLKRPNQLFLAPFVKTFINWGVFVTGTNLSDDASNSKKILDSCSETSETLIGFLKISKFCKIESKYSWDA